MTLDERCKKYRAEMMRYKRKYLALRLMLNRLFKDIVECSYDVDNFDGTVDTVVDVNDVMSVFGKYAKGDENDEDQGLREIKN